MTNPVPEPHGGRLLPGRLEWDAAGECFVLRYASAWAGRMRCEMEFGLQDPRLGLLLALSLPISLPLLAGTLLLHSSDEASTLRIFEWGVRDSTPRMTLEAHWPHIRRVSLRGGDLFVLWRTPSNPAIPGCYFPRECFAEDDEARFCEEILLSLWHSRGQDWSQARNRLLARQTVRQSRRPNFPPQADEPFEPLR